MDTQAGNMLTQAREISTNQRLLPELDELKKMISALKASLEFGLARKVLEKARLAHKHDIWIVQQLALCTYKDEELMPANRFEDALHILESIGLRDPDNTVPETLSLGGAVYKRMWEYGGLLEHLHEALLLYSAAWERNPEKDEGYGAVNAAYILDVLASRARLLSRRTGTSDQLAIEYTNRARELRAGTLAILQKKAESADDANNYWLLPTLAELHFGLGNYDQAGELLAKAKTHQPSEWERQTTIRQLINIARAQGIQQRQAKDKNLTPEWKQIEQALGQFLEPDQVAAASTSYRGKVGLALSGGGFRASFFHLGVLARLAEIDALRSVEALSTVSGGSIVGAHYYLELQKLLSENPDKELKKEQYIELVQRLQKRFTDGVQHNLRMRTLSNLLQNFRMIFSKEYSRSHRLGELYEKHLYAEIGEQPKKRRTKRTMPELLVKPADTKEGEVFKPKFSNWRRSAKVPILLLNTTSLNSGHSWHFTARWMGEPPGSIGSEIDVNERYRRLWYQQAPKKSHQQYRLGYAVAASSCVPGLFEPLVLEGLYPERTVRLVDGGVHDNQGIEALLDEGCTLILCSDASGQMEDQAHPSDSLIGVPLRANSILMDRVREAQYQDLRTRIESNALHGLCFVHLKKELETTPLDWVKCDNPTKPIINEKNTTSYHIDRDLQYQLAAIRTDLDSFSEVEVNALMFSGYNMIDSELKRLDTLHKQSGEHGNWGDFDIQAQSQNDKWEFLKLAELMALPPDSTPARKDLSKQLDAAASLFFKIWRLDPWLRRLSWALAGVGLLLLIWFIYQNWNNPISMPALTVGGITIAIGLLLAGLLLPAIKWLQPQSAMRGYLNKTIVAVLGFVLTNIHIQIFDRLFLHRGRMSRLLKMK